jgi:hypothetical protein
VSDAERADREEARERLRRDYRPAFLRYLSQRDEPARTAGYALGRAAVAEGHTMLDLLAVHHSVLVEVLPEIRDPDEALAVVTSAAEFLSEVLATSSMTSQAFLAMRQQLAEAQAEVATLRELLAKSAAT